MPDIRPFAATTWHGNSAFDVGPYKVFEVLGSGGNGMVYRAVHSLTQVEVALKILSPTIASDSTWRARFIREARQLATLTDPHIVGCSDLGEQDGTLYMALELVRGGDAEVLLRRHGGIIPEAVLLPLARDTALGLAALHTARMIHRDIKPANILLTEDGRAKLGDLGLVQMLDHNRPLTLGDKIVGTPCFMSPEQVEGHVELDYRSDLYSFGGTLIQLLTGKPPFTGSSPWSILNQVMASPLPDPRRMAEGISDGMASIVLKAGAHERDDRYANATQMAEDLALLLAGEPLRYAPLITVGGSPVVVANPSRAPRVVLARPLVAGDDPLYVRMIAENLLVQPIHEAAQLTARCLDDPPDLVVLDLTDLRVFGLGALRNLRRRRELHELPILVLTVNQEDLIEGCWRAGASQVLVAPNMGNEDFIRAVRSTIGMDASEFKTMPVTRHFSPPEIRIHRHRERITTACTQARALLDQLPLDPLQLGELPAAIEEIASVLRTAEIAAGELDATVKSLLLAIQHLLRELAEMPQHAIAPVIRTVARGIDTANDKADRDPIPASPQGLALVVDDDAVSRLMMANALRVVGIQAETVNDANSALKATEQRQYDLILSDVMMEGLNGFQFISRLRQIPGYNSVPVIFVTSLADFDQFFRTIPGGACDLIAKPFLLTELGLKALIHLTAQITPVGQLTSPPSTP